MSATRTLGIDIGGSGIKGAPVDVQHGRLVAERFRVRTPKPATPETVAEVVAQIVHRLGGRGPIGVTFPGVVKLGVIQTATNLEKSWLGVDGAALFSARAGRPVTLLNDADAAGLAEMRFGAGRHHRGMVVMLTLGTGVGSAVFVNGHLVPNTELGFLEIDGRTAEERVADRVREARGLSWKAYAKRLARVIAHVEHLLAPDLVILGGGVSASAEKFLPRIRARVPVVAATLQNGAGIVGAALAAAEAAAPRRRASDRPSARGRPRAAAPRR